MWDYKLKEGGADIVRIHGGGTVSRIKIDGEDAQASAVEQVCPVVRPFHQVSCRKTVTV